MSYPALIRAGSGGVAPLVWSGPHDSSTTETDEHHPSESTPMFPGIVQCVRHTTQSLLTWLAVFSDLIRGSGCLHTTGTGVPQAHTSAKRRAPVLRPHYQRTTA